MLWLWVYLVGVVVMTGWLYLEDRRENTEFEEFDDYLITPETNLFLVLSIGIAWPVLLGVYAYAIGEQCYYWLRGTSLRGPTK